VHSGTNSISWCGCHTPSQTICGQQERWMVPNGRCFPMGQVEEGQWLPSTQHARGNWSPYACLIGPRRATLRAMRSKISHIIMDTCWYVHSLHSHTFGLVWNFGSTFSDSWIPIPVAHWNHYTSTAFHLLWHTFKLNRVWGLIQMLVKCQQRQSGWWTAFLILQWHCSKGHASTKGW